MTASEQDHELFLEDLLGDPGGSFDWMYYDTISFDVLRLTYCALLYTPV